MSVKAMTWAWEQSDLTDGEKLCLMALADHADDNGVCWPSNGHIGRKLGVQNRAVRARIEKLEEKKLLKRESRERGNGSQTSNRIFLALGGPGSFEPGGSVEPPGSLATAPEPSDTSVPTSTTAVKGEEQQSLVGVGDPVKTVFEKWKELYGGTRVKLTDGRKRRIRKRLKDGRSVDELIEALEGAKHDGWLMGTKDDSPGYTGIDTLLRDDDQVLRLIALHRNPPKRQRRFKAERDPGETGHKGW